MKMHDYLNVPPCIICTPCIIWFRNGYSGIFRLWAFRKYKLLCVSNVHNKEYAPLKQIICIFLYISVWNIFSDLYICDLWPCPFSQFWIDGKVLIKIRIATSHYLCDARNIWAMKTHPYSQTVQCIPALGFIMFMKYGAVHDLCRTLSHIFTNYNWLLTVTKVARAPGKSVTVDSKAHIQPPK